MLQVLCEIRDKAQAPLEESRRAGWEGKAKDFLYLNLAEKVRGGGGKGGGFNTPRKNKMCDGSRVPRMHDADDAGELGGGWFHCLR